MCILIQITMLSGLSVTKIIKPSTQAAHGLQFKFYLLFLVNCNKTNKKEKKNQNPIQYFS